MHPLCVRGSVAHFCPAVTPASEGERDHKPELQHVNWMFELVLLWDLTLEDRKTPNDSTGFSKCCHGAHHQHPEMDKESAGTGIELEALGWGQGVAFTPAPRIEALLRGCARFAHNPVFCSSIPGDAGPRGRAGGGGAFLRAMRGGGREGVFCVCLSSSAAQCEQPREPVMFPPQLCIRGSEKKQIIPAWRCIKRSSEYFLQIHLFKTEARKYTLLLPFPPTSQLTSPFGALPSQMLESRALSPKHER